jgi:hypothetical protein
MFGIVDWLGIQASKAACGNDKADFRYDQSSNIGGPGK